MRLNYYKFPDDTPEEILLEHGCDVLLKDGGRFPVSHIPDDKRELVAGIDHTIGGVSVKYVKELIKEFGGFGWTEHCERDGSVFEVTDVKLKGNNSRFKYNRHL